MLDPSAIDRARSAVLQVPRSADTLSLVRLFASAVGRQLDVSDEIVEDLKLALTEVCSAAIETTVTPDITAVTVSWSSDVTGLVVRVAGSSPFSLGGAVSDERARLLRALGLEVHALEEDRGVEFELPLS
jgi:hypothetical protein